MRKQLTYFTDLIEGNSFEKDYLKLRALEGWIYEGDELKMLPVVGENDPHRSIWEIRKQTADLMVEFLKGKRGDLLEIGCGNGWFSNYLASKTDLEVIGIDINVTELEMAVNQFNRKDLTFGYANVFAWEPSSKFDFIVINGAVQYFEGVDNLIDRLDSFLSTNGEIHIVDSPIYKTKNESQKARMRSIEYFDKMGFPQLADSYHHHTFSDFPRFKNRVGEPSLLARLIGKKVGGFPWLQYRKER